jgi:hypothetical protein
MAGQLISDASGYQETEFDTKIPSLSDQANIVEAFKLYHYGLDNYTGSEPPAENSIHSHLSDLDGRIEAIEGIQQVTLGGTPNQITVSASVGPVVIGLSDDIEIQNNLTVSGSAAISGTLEIGGNLIVSGSTEFVNTENLSVTDPMIFLATNNTTDSVDIGLVGTYNDGSTKYTGIVRDASDGMWKFFAGITEIPTSTVDFASAQYASLKMGSLEVTNNLTVDGVSDIRIPSNQKTSSYTLILSDVGKMVEMGVSTSNAVTVPPDSSVAFPVGSQIVIVQTGIGQTTITPGSGVTVNGTPGLKLRTQWSSASLIKRSSNTWIAFGDLIS